MSKLGRSIVGALLAVGLCSGTAWAGETVFTDDGWYRVEGSAPTPVMDATDGTVTTEPAAARAAAPAATPAQAAAQPMLPPPMSEEAPRCLDERGALMRRVLELHGLPVSSIDVRDRDLGALGAVGYGAPLPFSASLSLDPDLNLLSGNAPVPPSSVNWDEEARWDWAALLDCQSRS